LLYNVERAGVHREIALAILLIWFGICPTPLVYVVGTTLPALSQNHTWCNKHFGASVNEARS
jgi:hypothetical protein